MDKRKKYFCVMAVVLILLSGYGKISDSAFRMWVTRMIAGEGMLRLVAAQYGQKAAEPVAETASDRSEKEDRPRVALTFDDGPSPLTEQVLDILKNENYKLIITDNSKITEWLTVIKYITYVQVRQLDFKTNL